MANKRGGVPNLTRDDIIRARPRPAATNQYNRGLPPYAGATGQQALAGALPPPPQPAAGATRANPQQAGAVNMNPNIIQANNPVFLQNLGNFWLQKTEELKAELSDLSSFACEPCQVVRPDQAYLQQQQYVHEGSRWKPHRRLLGAGSTDPASLFMQLDSPNCRNLSGFEGRKNFADLRLKYKPEMKEALGEGAFGLVKCFRNKHTNDVVAVKQVTLCPETYRQPGQPSAYVKEFFSTQTKIEIEIYLELQCRHGNKGHANIINLLEVYYEPDSVYLIYPRMHGSLFKRAVTYLFSLESGGKIKEDTVKIIVYQMLNAVDFLHDNGICHRDLKLDNILCAHPLSLYPVKISDFDAAAKPTAGPKPGPPNGLKKKVVGTFMTRAPEVVFGGLYSAKVDCFAIGHMMYELACCKSWTTYAQLSSNAQQLIYHLLRPYPEDRLSAKQALQHDWLKDLANPNQQAQFNAPSISFFNA